MEEWWLRKDCQGKRSNCETYELTRSMAAVGSGDVRMQDGRLESDNANWFGDSRRCYLGRWAVKVGQGKRSAALLLSTCRGVWLMAGLKV